MIWIYNCKKNSKQILKDVFLVTFEMLSHFNVIKSLGKYEQRYLYVSAIIVEILLTRLPISEATDRRFLLYKGVIILYFNIRDYYT